MNALRLQLLWMQKKWDCRKSASTNMWINCTLKLQKNACVWKCAMCHVRHLLCLRHRLDESANGNPSLLHLFFLLSSSSLLCFFFHMRHIAFFLKKGSVFLVNTVGVLRETRSESLWLLLCILRQRCARGWAVCVLSPALHHPHVLKNLTFETFIYLFISFLEMIYHSGSCWNRDCLDPGSNTQKQAKIL